MSEGWKEQCEVGKASRSQILQQCVDMGVVQQKEGRILTYSQKGTLAAEEKLGRGRAEAGRLARRCSYLSMCGK